VLGKENKITTHSNNSNNTLINSSKPIYGREKKLRQTKGHPSCQSVARKQKKREKRKTLFYDTKYTSTVLLL
jgi:hypothetical protein